MLHIKFLKVNDFRILHNFEVHFEKPLSMLIGINGSGKTTIIEALGKIFSSLHTHYIDKISVSPDIRFTIIYDITFEDERHNNRIDAVEVTATRNQSGFSFLTRNNYYDTDELIDKLGYEAMLPNVVVYYSGFSKKLEKIGRIHELRYNKQLANISENVKDAFSKVKPIPVMYTKDIHFDILLASLFAFQYDTRVDDFFANELGIHKPFDRLITIYIKRKRFRKYEAYDYEGFGGAQGEILNFLNVLRDKSILSSEAIRLTPINNNLVFVFNIYEWYSVLEWCQTERRLFSFLYALYCAGVLDKISVRYWKDNVEDLHTNLSEGERQLITIRGLCELVGTGNTLFLFDEPSAFMHPSWQDNFVVNVADILSSQELSLQSHFISATHSPSSINHLFPDKGELLILDKGQLQEHSGHFYGRDVNSILINYMHANQRPEEINLNITELGALIDQKMYDEAEMKLQELKEKLKTNADLELSRLETKLKFLNRK